jgi:hypothetical protein
MEEKEVRNEWSQYGPRTVTDHGQHGSQHQVPDDLLSEIFFHPFDVQTLVIKYVTCVYVTQLVRNMNSMQR